MARLYGCCGNLFARRRGAIGCRLVRVPSQAASSCHGELE